MGTYESGSASVKSLAERLTGVPDGDTVELFTITFSEYPERVEETLGGVR